MYTVLVYTHVLGVLFGLLSGALSMLFRKGSSLHRIAGNIFFVTMVAMTTSASWIAAFMRPNRLNLLGGTLTLYLVVTGWAWGKRRDGKAGRFDVAVLLFAISIALLGFQSATGGGIVFGVIALLFAQSDFRTIKRGGAFGKQRIALHLWRMGLAYLFTVFSFFPGRANMFPDAWRKSGLLLIPHLLILMSLGYWMRRMSRSKRETAPAAIEHQEIAA